LKRGRRETFRREPTANDNFSAASSRSFRSRSSPSHECQRPSCRTRTDAAGLPRANWVALLASDLGGYINGQRLVIDGGSSHAL